MSRGLLLAALCAIVIGVIAGQLFLKPRLESAAKGSEAGQMEQVDVPSGLLVQYHEMLWDRPGGGLVYRFRFVAPGIGKAGGPTYEDVASDMEFLCNTFAVPRMANTGPKPGQIVISFSDQVTKFGVINHDVTQFFEAYRPENGVCIWEPF